MLQFAAVHELYPFPKFTFFKAVSVRHMEMVIQHFERANAVNAVNGREQIVWIIEICLILQKCRQIKIVFGKHNPNWLDPPGYQLWFLHPLILNFQYLMLLNCLPYLPKPTQDLFVMVRLSKRILQTAKISLLLKVCGAASWMRYPRDTLS